MLTGALTRLSYVPDRKPGRLDLNQRPTVPMITDAIGPPKSSVQVIGQGVFGLLYGTSRFAVFETSTSSTGDLALSLSPSPEHHYLRTAMITLAFGTQKNWR